MLPSLRSRMRALLHRWRPGESIPGATTTDQAAFERCLAGLEPRVPAGLLETWREATRRLDTRPASDAQVLEALQRMHRGLGVAIGRGDVGEDERYEQLLSLVTWLSAELGRAANCEGVRVRPAAVADAVVLRELAERTFRDSFAEHNSAEDMQAYVQKAFSLEQVVAELADPAGEFLLAQAGEHGPPLGYAKLRRGAPNPAVVGPDPVELQRLYVDRTAQGQGVGAALMQAALASARAAGHRTLWLAVWERNARARAFYERWEFHPVGEQVFRLGSDDQRDVVMARPVHSVASTPEGPMTTMASRIATLLLATLAVTAEAQPQPAPPVGVFVTQSVEALRAQTEAHAGSWRLGREQSWSVDQDRGVIEFLFEDGVVASAPVQIVGTYNPRSGTFLWGWDHPSVDAPLRRAAAAARAFGLERGVARYVEREVACTEAEAWEFTAVAARLDGASGAYRADAGGPLVYMTFGEITLSRRP